VVEVVTIALIGVIITGIGIGIGLYFNIRATNQNTKSRYYQILKDNEERFHQIQSLDKDADPRTYFMHTSNFATFLYQLVEEGICPKDLIMEYRETLGEGLWVIKNVTSLEKEFLKYIKFCEDNKIKPKMPSRSRLKGRINADSVTSLIFSSDENKDADIYNCPVCRSMFGTKEEFSKHKKEAKCKPKSD